MFEQAGTASYGPRVYVEGRTIHVVNAYPSLRIKAILVGGRLLYADVDDSPPEGSKP